MHCLRLLSRMRASTNINLKLRNMTEGEYQLVDDCRCRKRLSLVGAMERGEGARDGCFIHQHKPSARRLISFDWKRVEALPHYTEAAVSGEAVGKCGVPSLFCASLTLPSIQCLSSPLELSGERCKHPQRGPKSNLVYFILTDGGSNF